MDEQTKPLDPRRTALTKARYDRNAASYDERTAMMERLVFGRLRARIWSLVAGREVLEVGIGTGTTPSQCGITRAVQSASGRAAGTSAR